MSRSFALALFASVELERAAQRMTRIEDNMTEKIEKTVYTFRELIAASNNPDSDMTERDVQKARDWLSEGATDHEWWDCLLDDWKQALEQIGFENANIHFSGFSSQGDGTSFTADVDLDKLVHFLATDIPAKYFIDADDKDNNLWLPYAVHKMGNKTTNPRYKRLLKIRDYIDCAVNRTSSRYSHESTCRFVGDFRDNGECGPRPDYEWISCQPRLRELVEAFFADAESLRVDLCFVIYKALEAEYCYLLSDECLIENAEANEYRFDENGHYEC